MCLLWERVGGRAKAHCNEQEAKGCNRRSHPLSAFLSVLTPCALPKIVLVAPNTDPLSCDVRLYELTLKLIINLSLHHHLPSCLFLPDTTIDTG